MAEQEKFKEAVLDYDEAEEKYQDLGNNFGLANTLSSRGVLLALQGEFDKALKLLEEGYSLYLELCNSIGQANCLINRYLCLMNTDRTGEAEKLRPLMEALLPDLPPPMQEQIREILAIDPSEPED